eukprot:7391998-Prymnesium_polylepis.6
MVIMVSAFTAELVAALLVPRFSGGWANSRQKSVSDQLVNGLITTTLPMLLPELSNLKASCTLLI